MKRKASKQRPATLIDADIVELANGIRDALKAYRTRVDECGEYEVEDELLADRDLALQLGAAMQGHPERFQAVADFAGEELSAWLHELLSELARCADYDADALAILDQLQTAVGNEHFIMYRPMLLAIANRYDEACAAVDAALAKSPADTVLQVAAAETYCEAGRFVDGERLVQGLLTTTRHEDVCHGCLKEHLHEIYANTNREAEAQRLEQELIAAEAAGTLHH